MRPEWPVPHANGDDHCFLCGEADARKNKERGTTGEQLAVWRHPAESSELMPVRIDFVAGHQSWKIESEWLRARRNADAEAIPSEPAHSGIALRAPSAMGPKQRPRGIVKRRIGPAAIVAGMKPPQSVKTGKRHAALVQIKCLGADGFCCTQA